MFNVSRWEETPPPACCGIVPLLYRGPFHSQAVEGELAALEAFGSKAAPGFMQPEGIVVYLPAARELFKVTLGDDGHKGTKEAA